MSALYDVYEYVIEDNEISKIITYMVESLTDTEKIGETVSFEISFIDFDEDVYDENLDDYEIIDYGENSFNDGEYMPFWYQGSDE